jgi:hypothetical protein
MIGISGCAGDDTSGASSTETLAAALEDSPGISPRLAKQEVEARRERIRAHFRDKLARLDVVATTYTSRGTTIDWVPRSPDLIASPRRSVIPVRLEPGEVLAESPLETEPQAKGPEGTLPMVRFDVERYLEVFGSDIPDNPQAVQPPDPSPEGSGRYYALWRATRISTGPSFWGMTAHVNLWNAPDLVSGDHNIAETSVSRGTGTGQQTVEAGKIQWSGWNGGDPTFFVFFTTAGYSGASGDWIKGYNASQLGWCQTSTSWVPGMEFSSSSVVDGNQVVIQVETENWGGNWYVFVNGTEAGYYPLRQSNANCSSSNGTYLFSNGGLRTKASRLSAYGEVFDGNAPAATTTDMGSGYSSASGQGRAAFFRTVRAIPDDVGNYIAMHSVNATLSNFATDSSCYDMQTPQNLGGSTVNRFYYGGEGDENTNCN